MHLSLADRTAAVKDALDDTYVTTLRVLSRWIFQHGEHGRAHPGLERLAAERARCRATMVTHLAVLRQTGLAKRVGPRSYWDRDRHCWVRLADTYELTRAGRELLKRGAPQQEDALARVVAHAPPRRGAPLRTWVVNLVQYQAGVRQAQRQRGAMRPEVRQVLTRMQHVPHVPQTPNHPVSQAQVPVDQKPAPQTPTQTTTAPGQRTPAATKAGLDALAAVLGLNRPFGRPPTR